MSAAQRALLMSSLPALPTAGLCLRIPPHKLAVVSKLLAEAFKKVSEELPEYEQDALAEWLIQVIETDEREWDALFAASPDILEKLADQALAEYSEGQTDVLDLAKLSKL